MSDSKSIYQQTVIDTYSKVGFAKLNDRKTLVTAAKLLNDRVLPFFEENGIPLTRILTGRGAEYCGAPDLHEYELYLAVKDIEHTRTKTKRPQTNGVSERFHKALLNEFYWVALWKKIDRSLRNCKGTSALGSRSTTTPTTPGPLVLRQDADADVSGYRVAGEGEDVGRVSTQSRGLRACQMNS